MKSIDDGFLKPPYQIRQSPLGRLKYESSERPNQDNKYELDPKAGEREKLDYFAQSFSPRTSSYNPAKEDYRQAA